MHKIKLNVQDTIYTDIMHTLRKLNKNDIEIIEDESFNNKSKKAKKLNAISIKTNNFKFNREEANAR